MALLKHGWARFGAGVAVLASICFGAGGAGPVLARQVYDGKATEVGGKFTCDCTAADSHSCFCIGGGS